MAASQTRDGRPWTPYFLDAIDATACIGCGRCYKVCGRGVMEPLERAFDEDDDEEESITTVMGVADAGACIGCAACGKVCAKRAHTHVAAA